MVSKYLYIQLINFVGKHVYTCMRCTINSFWWWAFTCLLVQLIHFDG